MRRKKVINTGQEITQITELADRNAKTIVTVVFHVLKKLEERLNFEGLKITQDAINVSSDIVEDQ